MSRHGWRRRAIGAAALALLAGGGTAIGLAAASQVHAPQPPRAVAGTTGRAAAPPAHPVPAPSPVAPVRPTASSPAVEGPVLPPSTPLSIAIPAIGVRSPLLQLGLNTDGTLQVPQPGPDYNDAAWYRYSPTPGQEGPAVIEGHIDSAADGPSVFFRLGALEPGDQIDVSRADGTVAVFTVSGVREYPKDAFPTATVYGNTPFAALRLLTCGGPFDRARGSYEDNIVVFASLTSARPATPGPP